MQVVIGKRIRYTLFVEIYKKYKVKFHSSKAERGTEDLF